MHRLLAQVSGDEVIRDCTPTARKAHVCVWCAEQILKAERYHRQVLVFDGEFQSNAWHLECFDAADFRDLQDGFTLGSGTRGIREQLSR